MANPPRDMLPIARPWIDDEEYAAVQRPLRSGWVTQGPEVKAFEDEFAAFVGSRHACAVSNCTAALHLALRAVGVISGSEVITVSHSFIATTNAIRYCGATPVFVDVEKSTFNLDPRKLEAAVTTRTAAILCVHQMGMPCDLRSILAIADTYDIPVVEDAACAVGSDVQYDGQWQRIGRPHGHVACFSFHPRKVITTGDGGMLTTHSAIYDEQFRLWRQHGMTVPDTVRHESGNVIFEKYSEVGYNYRMTDLQAAIGRVQLGRLEIMVARRRELASYYFELLSNTPEITLPVEPDWARSNWQSFCIRLPQDADQKGVMRHLLDNGVASRRGIMCAHREDACTQESWSCAGSDTCDCLPGACMALRESELAQDHCILLPLFHQMTLADVRYIAEACERAIESSRYQPLVL